MLATKVNALDKVVRISNELMRRCFNAATGLSFTPEQLREFNSLQDMMANELAKVSEAQPDNVPVAAREEVKRPNPPQERA